LESRPGTAAAGAAAREGLTPGPERIAHAFASARKRAALMPYLMGGYPDLRSSLAIGEAFAEAGADLVEVGVPFSDPLADGPVIQAAGQHALEAGATLERVVEEVARPLSRRLPVALMCYANPIHARGFDAVSETLGKAGIDGLIVPDLPAEEAAELRGRQGAVLIQAPSNVTLDLVPPAVHHPSPQQPCARAHVNRRRSCAERLSVDTVTVGHNP
jgi:hypothetical protein